MTPDYQTSCLDCHISLRVEGDEFIELLTILCLHSFFQCTKCNYIICQQKDMMAWKMGRWVQDNVHMISPWI